MTTISKRGQLAITAALVGIPAGLLATAPQSDAATERPAHVRQYPQCAQEDGQLCVWRNEGPGYSFVAGKDRNPGPREDIARFRVSDRIADILIARDNWRQAPAGTYDLIHPTRSGQTRVRINEHSVMSIGPTTYVITGRLVAGS